MHLFLIRHGESVDNVSGIYAGRRDSALTSHGVQQARRLGSWFAANRLPLTHVFSSPLQRAYKTANVICLKQPHRPKSLDHGPSQVSIVKVDQLVEQDFGFYEGKPSYSRQRDSSKKTGREAQHEAHRDSPGFVDVESKDLLAKRCDAFLDTHLLPLFDHDKSSVEPVVAIVSHGILLSHLWRRLLLRLPPKSVTIVPEVMTARGQIVLEHLGGWSNTGFLELSNIPSGSIVGATTTILTIDGQNHLQSLKRTRGGIGKAQHDEKQKTMDSFFKRAKRE